MHISTERGTQFHHEMTTQCAPMLCPALSTPSKSAGIIGGGGETKPCQHAERPLSFDYLLQAAKPGLSAVLIYGNVGSKERSGLYNHSRLGFSGSFPCVYIKTAPKYIITPGVYATLLVAQRNTIDLQEPSCSLESRDKGARRRCDPAC